MNVLLISTYELGRQPFGLASPAAWLRRDGFSVACLDCAVSPLDEETVRSANLIAFFTPMHTACRLALALLARVQEINPSATICFYGLYAPMNEEYLRRKGVEVVLGGEFESGLLQLARRLRQGSAAEKPLQPQPSVSLAKQTFHTPDRSDLPPLSRYAQLIIPGEAPRLAGYTEATRGCKYQCRHCPVVPVYQGKFRVVQQEAVLADIRQQVQAGAQHITLGDPDFLNGPGHALKIVRALHREFPRVSYDVVVKVEHLRKFADLIPELESTNCRIVTTAVESLNNRLLALLDKGHTREDFLEVAERFRRSPITLNPTFVPFTPWTRAEDYLDLLKNLWELQLTEQVSPVQLAIRLLIPEGSLLLERPELTPHLQGYDEEMLGYRWRHPDPRMDALQKELMAVVNRGNRENLSRSEIFLRIWKTAAKFLQASAPEVVETAVPPRAAVPYLNEPWYC